MHADLLHPSRFLKSAEFGGRDVTFTIAEVALEELERDDSSKEMKGVVSFRETSKMLLLNRTNSTCLKEMFGVETEQWKGKRVTFFPFPMTDPFTKKPITAIRLRGSPDLKAPVGVSIKLRKRKAQIMTMVVTGNAGASVASSNDPIEVQVDAIRSHMRGLTTPEAMDKSWLAGLGARIGGLPPSERDEMKKEFAALKTALIRGAKAAATEEPPPSDDQPTA